jgi:hypothetical protein
MPRTLQRLFGLLLVSLSLVANLQAQTPETGKPKQPLAMIDGQAINDDDLLPYVQAQLRPLREQEYQIKKKALENLINQRLLEAAANNRRGFCGLTGSVAICAGSPPKVHGL